MYNVFVEPLTADFPPFRLQALEGSLQTLEDSLQSLPTIQGRLQALEGAFEFIFG